MAKQQLTKAEKDLLIELIANKQIKHLIPNDGYSTKQYYMLEELKIKIKNI